MAEDFNNIPASVRAFSETQKYLQGQNKSDVTCFVGFMGPGKDNGFAFQNMNGDIRVIHPDGGPKNGYRDGEDITDKIEDPANNYRMRYVVESKDVQNCCKALTKLPEYQNNKVVQEVMQKGSEADKTASTDYGFSK